jgi:hypothetical protein
MRQRWRAGALAALVAVAVAAMALMPACAARAPRTDPAGKTQEGAKDQKAQRASRLLKPPKPPKPVIDKYSGLPARQVYDLAMQKMKRRSWFKTREILQKVLGRQDATPELVALVHLAVADAF